MMDGKCFQFDATTITRESLIAEGIRPEAADELLAFARLLFAKRARHAAACAWHRNDPSGCDCGLAGVERRLLAEPCGVSP